LGNAAWITDKNGLPVQYLMYAPYGEQLLNQQSTTTYNERFTFTGKERDKETGYVHFDARNLFEVASIWLSPDPLLDKYIYNSPYVYCEGNPIKYVDPDGRDIYRYDKKNGKFILYSKTSDNFDQVGIFKYDKRTKKHVLKTDSKGNPRVYSAGANHNDKITKGILKDGLNLRDNPHNFILRQGGLTAEDLYHFALMLDQITGKEISGYVLNITSAPNSQIVYMRPYGNNRYNRSKNTIPFIPDAYSVLRHFHTHGQANNYQDATQASVLDEKFRDRITKLYPKIQLLIINNYDNPIVYDPF
jgi:RHS repeat-associated protein